MKLDLYQSRAGSVWLVPEGAGVMIAMEATAFTSFKADAGTYGERWTEEDCPEYALDLRETHLKKLTHVASFEDGQITVHAKKRDLFDHTKGYLGLGIGNAVFNALHARTPQHETRP